jgi:hypothetical protein
MFGGTHYKMQRPITCNLQAIVACVEIVARKLVRISRYISIRGRLSVGSH